MRETKQKWGRFVSLFSPPEHNFSFAPYSFTVDEYSEGPGFDFSCGNDNHD